MTLQPMTSAPRNGTEILLKVERRAGAPGCFLVGHWMEGGHCIDDHPPIDRGWYFWNGCIFDKAAEPIAWAPLPQSNNPGGAPMSPLTEPPRDATRVPRPLDEWHEDHGDVLWWCWDGNGWLCEAPYIGSPLDFGHTVECHTHRETGEKPAARFDVGGWPGYHTHWTPLPVQPYAPDQPGVANG